MIRKAVTALILAPLTVAAVAFAVANRQTIVVSFDPFDRAHPAFAVTLPLFALLLAVAIAGVLIGGVAAWVRQNKWRRAARLAQAQARELKTELDHLNQQIGAAEPRKDMAPLYVPRLTIPPPAA